MCVWGGEGWWKFKACSVVKTIVTCSLMFVVQNLCIVIKREYWIPSYLHVSVLCSIMYLKDHRQPNYGGCIRSLLFNQNDWLKCKMEARYLGTQKEAVHPHRTHSNQNCIYVTWIDRCIHVLVLKRAHHLNYELCAHMVHV